MSKRRERRNVLAWVVAAAILCLVVWVLLANVVFVVRDVQVVGAGEVSQTDVRHLSGIRLGSRMFGLNEKKVHANVESDGRLAFVGLEKRLPSTVVLTVRPRSMDALILLGGKIVALDSDAYVIRTLEQLPDKRVPYVTGIKAAYYAPGRQLDTADGRCLAMKAVLEAAKAQGATAYISELDVSNIADMRVISRTGMSVLLGDSKDMSAKIAWMAGALADLEARGETTGQLDVSSGDKADYTPPAREEEPTAEGQTEVANTDAAADQTQTAVGQEAAQESFFTAEQPAS